MTKLRPWIAASLLAAGLTTSLDAQQGARPPRQVVPVDSARAPCCTSAIGTKTTPSPTMIGR